MTAADGKDRSPEAWARAARLGQSLELDGELRGREDCVIQGRVRGKILLPESDLLIAEDARVEADIQVRDIIVRGEVTGNISASGRAVIEKTGRLDGDLAASMISVEDGARFKGSVKILRKT
jgi:cytoskeletal protein CcmA (bactofilin family)